MKNLLLTILFFITLQSFAQYPQKIDTAKTMLWLITDKQLQNAVAQSDSLVIFKQQNSILLQENKVKDSILFEFKMLNSMQTLRVNDLENKFDNCETDLNKMYLLEKKFNKDFAISKKLNLFFAGGGFVVGILLTHYLLK